MKMQRNKNAARILIRWAFSCSRSSEAQCFPRACVFPLELACMTEATTALKQLIRDIPDFPKPGILFRDITPLLADPSGLALAVELLANPFRGKNIDLVVGAESRGFIFGTAVACCLFGGLRRRPQAGQAAAQTISR